MVYKSIWSELEHELDHIWNSIEKERKHGNKQPQNKIKTPKKLTADRIEQIKDDVHAEETHCWEGRKVKTSEEIVFDEVSEWYRNYMGEELEDTMRSAENTIKAGKAAKKRAEISKCSDSMKKKNQQLTNIIKGN